MTDTTAIIRLIPGVLPGADEVRAMEEFRCFHCGALLARTLLAAPSIVSVKCYRRTCQRMNTLRAC